MSGYSGAVLYPETISVGYGDFKSLLLKRGAVEKFNRSVKNGGLSNGFYLKRDYPWSKEGQREAEAEGLETARLENYMGQSVVEGLEWFFASPVQGLAEVAILLSGFIESGMLGIVREDVMQNQEIYLVKPGSAFLKKHGEWEALTQPSEPQISGVEKYLLRARKAELAKPAGASEAREMKNENTLIFLQQI